MNLIKQYWLEYEQFTIGFSQITLSKDHKYFWITVEVLAHIQKLSILFLFRVIVVILQERIYNIQFKEQNTYQLYELFSKLSIPTILIIESASNPTIIGISGFIIMILYFPFFANLIAMRHQKYLFSNIKYRSSVEEQENLNYTLNLLNRSYNMHNWIEYFLQKQFMQNQQASFQQLERFIQASFLNIYPHILVIPLLAWHFFLWIIILQDDSLTIYEEGLLICFNLIICFGIIFNWHQSMKIQLSFTIRDCNHLRLVQSFWFNLTQFFIIAPITLQFIYCLLFLEEEFDISSTSNYVNLVLVLILQLGNLIDIFLYHPYALPYKISVQLIVIPFTLSTIISLLFQHSQIEIVSVCLISVPLCSRFLHEIMTYLNEEILYSSQYKEKQKTRQRVQSKTGLLVEEEQQFVIEKEINLQKKNQIEYLQNQNTKYFIHYLRQVDLMQLDDQQSIEKDASVINVKRSKFILNVIILLKSHISQCENVYCYCKGFRGERRKLIEKNYHELDMKIYNSIKIQNLTIQVELIKRYIRYYTKLIFQLEKEKENYDIIRITQLLTYLSSSEECYQVLLLLMEFKEKVSHHQDNLSNIALSVVTGYTKHQILQKMNLLVKFDDVETSLQYKDFRVTEVRRDRLISEMLSNIQVKYEFLKKIIDNKYNYEELYQLISHMVNYNLGVIRKIEQFQEFSNSRTSLLLYMFYSLEIINDFDKFIRLRNQLKTKSYKFFEYESISSNPQAQRVCYLKINLARHAKKGKISRGEIIQFSNNAPHMFGYGQREFKEEILTVHQLVSPHLSVIHDQVMEIFLLTNRPQVLRKKRGLLAYRKNQDFLFVEMFLDLCFNISGDSFPIYGFLKQINSDGAYENIKGHIFLTHELRIEGISTLALEQFKLKDGKSLQKRKIFRLIQNFKKYQDLLKDKEQKFYESEQERLEAGSCSNQFNYNESEQLLNHFTVSAEDILFRIPKEPAPDIYCVSCKFIMTIGRINEKEYKSYMIQFSKITFADNTSQVWIESSKNLTKTDEYFDSQNRDVTVSEKQSEKLFTDSDQNCEFSNINENKSNKSIHFDEYQFQIGMNIISPFDSQRDLLSLMNEEKCQTPQLQMIENNINSVQIEHQSLQHLQQQIGQSMGINKTHNKYQQSYFQKSNSKKSLELDNDQSEHRDLDKEQDIRITQTPTTGNNYGFPSILQKTHQYSKFSTRGKNPKLLKIIFAIDVLNFLLIITLSITFYFSFTLRLKDNMNIIDILRAFVTTDYTRNTMLAMGIKLNQQEQDEENEDIEYQTKLLNLVKTNCEAYLTLYQTYLTDNLVKTTLSDININQFDFYSGGEESVNAWTEQFYVIYMQQGLYNIDIYNSTSISKFKNSLTSLISQYQVHKEAYEELTVKFQDQLNTNVQLLQQQQNLCLIVYSILEVFLVTIYYIIYRQTFKLVNRIIRSCEQISFKSLESESIRLVALLHHFQQPSDLNLYKYNYQIKDKCNLNINVAELFSNQRITMRYKAKVQQQEQKKQFIISDEKSYFQKFFFLISFIASLQGFLYYLGIKIFTTTNITDLQNNLDLFNQNILYTEQYFQMMLSDMILQKSDSLREEGVAGPVANYYQTLVNESYQEVVSYTSIITSQAQQNYYDLLTEITNNACGLINDDMCSTIIGGKLTQGLIYAANYFTYQVRDNIQCNYTTEKINKISVLDLIALDFISTGFTRIIIEGQKYLVQKFETEINLRTILFVTFILFYVTYQTLVSFLVFRFFRQRFFKIRQLPYVLPPQSVYGEDSFLKTLVYVEKIYDNIQQ